MPALFHPPNLLDSPKWAGLRVGILGGSFNPPHEGHVHISLSALKGLKLDAVWWLVTPQNPLKEEKPLALEERMRLSQNLIFHPKILVSDLERQLGTTITYDTIKGLKAHYPKTDFVWISGMDNAHSLHKWHHWQDLLREIPMVHLSRKTGRSLVQHCPLRLYTRQKHVFVTKAARFPLNPGLTYWMLQKKMVNISSSEIRENGSKTAH